MKWPAGFGICANIVFRNGCRGHIMLHSHVSHKRKLLGEGNWALRHWTLQFISLSYGFQWVLLLLLLLVLWLPFLLGVLLLLLINNVERVGHFWHWSEQSECATRSRCRQNGVATIISVPDNQTELQYNQTKLLYNLSGESSMFRTGSEVPHWHHWIS